MDHKLQRAAWTLTLGLGLLLLLGPPLALGWRAVSEPLKLLTALTHPMIWPALRLSLLTTTCTIILTLLLGTPLAWWLSAKPTRLTRTISALVELPLVVPPAVMGLALLDLWGRQGILGALMASWGLPSVAMTPLAVILAQLLVSAPLYIQSATTAFGGVDPELIAQARTLGASPRQAWWHVIAPMALPGLIQGAALAWARALGELGATMLFAGSLMGKTQTMPLAILDAMEINVEVARACAMCLGTSALLILFTMRLTLSRWRRP